MGCKLKGTLAPVRKIKGSVGIPSRIYPAVYTGPTEVTPTQATQVLYTENLMLDTNITVNPIPSNYGLITWNGSTLTVS